MLRKFKRQKKIFIIIELLLLILIVGGICFLIFKKDNSDVDKKETNNKNNISENKNINKDIKIIDVNSKSRPLAIMINNASDARPYQKGLQKAYIVYEMINYADGSTRFMALFKDAELDEIGPIRSTRHYHLDYVLENDAIFVHWGYSPIAEDEILNKKLVDSINGITYGNTYFWTANISGLNVSHRRFTSSELLNKGIEKLGYDTNTETDNLFNYSSVSIEANKEKNVTPANKVEIYYSNSNYVTYEYNEESGNYLRSVKGKVHKDASTNEQLEVKNIITYKIKNTTIKGDDASRQELHNIGDGKGYYITEGYAIPIKWEKECRECQTKYTYESGEEIVLNDGNTFIQIQPSNEDLEIS